MQTIYKYEVTPEFIVTLDADMHPLKIMLQNNKPVLWIQHNPHADVKQPYKFVCVPTGALFYTFFNDYQTPVYVDSFIEPEYGFVFHLYYVVQ